MKCFQLDLFLDDLNLKLNKTSFEDFGVDESFENFLNIFADIVNTHAPLRKCTRKEKKLKVKPWLNKTLLKSIKKKNNMFKDLHKIFNQQSFHKYKAYRNALNRTIQGAKQMYYNKYFSSNKNNPAKIWDAIHELADLKPKKNITINRLMKENGDFVEEPKDVAQLLNKYFVDIGKNMAKAIPPIHSTYKPPPSTNSKNSLFMSPTTPEEIANVITSLINKKAIRSKDIETYFIKISGVTIAPILSKLFNQCLLEGEFPKYLKIAEVILIFKKGSATNVSNYRPISLLSQFDKIFEKIIYNRIIDFIEKYNLLSDHQFDFRQNSSTIHAVTYIYDNLIKNVDKGFYSRCIFLDLSKAFDTVDHHILLCKLKNYFGIRGKSFNLIKSYLTNRRQYTKISNIFSDELETNCGVPQGSCLGPLLFLLNINNLPLASQMNTTLYTDDTYLMMSDLNLTSLQNRINIKLKNIDFWLRKNKLSLNFSKSTFLLIHKQPSRTIKSTFEIKINDIMLTRSPIVKYPGLFIDQNLNWIPHIKSLSFHLARYTGLFYKLKLCTNMDTMKLLYHSLINSELQYGIIVWGATFKT